MTVKLHKTLSIYEKQNNSYLIFLHKLKLPIKTFYTTMAGYRAVKMLNLVSRNLFPFKAIGT